MVSTRIPLSDLGKKLKELTTDKLKQAIENANRQWTAVMATELKTTIVKTIQSGMSPVEGVGRYKGYSESYSEAIREGRYRQYGKKLRPINLTLSGTMLRSIKARQGKDNLTIYFSSPIAKYHDEEGAGKAKVIRRMLPSKPNEKFSRTIWTNIIERYNRILKQQLKQ